MNGYDKPCNKECSFEISPYETLKGGIRATLYEEGEKGPQDIISVDNEWYVKVEWYLTGGLERHLCGDFCLTVSFESIGKGKERDFGPVFVKMKPCGDGRYKYVFKSSDFKRFKVGDCGRLYHVGVSLTSRACGAPGHIKGYCDVGTVMFTRNAA